MRGVSLWQAACSIAARRQGRRGRRRIRAPDRARCAPSASACRCRRWSSSWSTRSGLIAYYETEKDGADRIENLNELVTAAAGF